MHYCYLSTRFSKTLSLLSGGFLDWSKWRELLSKLYLWVSSSEDDRGECPAKEVLQLNNREGHFASSLNSRSPRPRQIKFRVGQVIEHKIHHYRGVIVGWDEVLKVSYEQLSFSLRWNSYILPTL